MRRLLIILTALTLPLTPLAAHAGDWNLPLSVISGSQKTGLTLGVAANASNGFDRGIDVPAPHVGDTLFASFTHSDWNVIIDGDPVTSFSRDIRFNVPQDFSIEIKGTINTVTLGWDKSLIPAGVNLTLVDDQKGSEFDMKQVSTLTLPITSPYRLTAKLTPGDTTPPATPTGLAAAISGNSVYLTWTAVTDPDLAGYRLSYGQDPAALRSVDLKMVQNFNLANILAENPWYVSLSAYDKTGNASGQSEVLTLSRPVTQQPTGPVTPPSDLVTPPTNSVPPSVTPPTTDPVTPTVNYGDIDNDGRISVSDALSALQMAIGKKAVNLKADVAPLINGIPTPDGKVSTADALVILRKAVGLW